MTSALADQGQWYAEAQPVANLYQFALLLSDVGAVLFVFVAEVFKDVGVSQQIVGDFDAKWLRVHRGVLKYHFHVHVSEVAAVEPFPEAQRLAMEMAEHIE
jgi:hypothetical protein